MNNLKYLFLVAVAILTFSCNDKDDEIITPNNTETLQPNVGGPEQGNHVFIDLSTKQMKAVSRDSWDLAFACGNEFRVILNSSLGALAYPTSGEQLSEISGTDTTGLGNQLSLDAIFGALISPAPPAWLTEAVNWVDAPSGDLSQTAIAEVSAVAEYNNVHIINSGKNPNNSLRPWYKIKVDQNGGGYELNFASIDGGPEQSQTINKNTDQNFIFFSFENGIVNVQPDKTEWDIAFTTFTDYVFVGYNVPYFYQDFVIQNRDNSSVAEYIIGDQEDLLTEFENFSSNDVSSVIFNPETNVIGANWRTVASPTPGTVTGVKTDRFYIVQDNNGVNYKLLFSQMLSDLGERGYPEFIFEELN